MMKPSITSQSQIARSVFEDLFVHLVVDGVFDLFVFEFWFVKVGDAVNVNYTCKMYLFVNLVVDQVFDLFQVHRLLHRKRLQSN